MELTRRDLLSRAAGVAAVASALRGQTSGSSAMPRVRETFDFGWKFFKGDAPGAEEPAFSDAAWRTLDLPHDWSIEGPFGEHEPSGGSGGYLPTGIGWYRKRFRVPADDRARKFSIEFDGVYENSHVWINGHYLGLRPYGYISFAYDLTPNLNLAGENVVAVKVDNSHQRNSRWYSGSGIYRHTWLVITNPVHLAHWGTWVTTPRISPHEAVVEVKTKVRNETAAPGGCTIASSIIGHDGILAAAASAAQEVGANAECEFVQQIRLRAPLLWSVDAPNLYRLHTTLTAGGQTVDEYDTHFGIREAVFDGDRGFLLNGEHVKLNGACMHHAAGSVGAAVPERVWERRFEILKQMGCNAIRTSHNPPAPEFLDLCDRMGFLVMDEAFDEWRVPKGQIDPYGYSAYFDEWHERDVTDFVHRDRNHPSVVLWSAGNEIPDQIHPGGVETARELVAIFHREDPARPVTAACDQIAAAPKAVPPEFLAQLDIVGYNYVDRWRDRADKYYSIDRHDYPRRRFVGTESTGLGGARGDYRGLFPGAPPGLFVRYLRSAPLNVEELWQFVRIYDYVSGDFMWTGIDYLGESHWPSRSSASGVLDTCGFKKDGYYFYQSQWTPNPMLHLFPHWTWKGREGDVLPVKCYTNCDTVELFANGKSFGVKGYEFPRHGMEKHWPNLPPRAMALRTTSDLHLEWDVPYEPGTLKAVGVKDGKVVAQQEVSTAGEAAAIALSADRETIQADRRDVAHITVRVVDAEGRLVPEADNEITFEIEGAARLIGADNGDPESHEDFKSNRRKAFHGLCLAILQSTARPGSVRVSASAPGLQSASVTVTTRAQGTILL
jgi:beta-galactosidase